MDSIAWWDGEQVKPNPPGPGVLVEAIRRGGIKPTAAPMSSVERNRVYAETCAAWLQEHFPEVCRASDRMVAAIRTAEGDLAADRYAAPWPQPHPAALAAVFRLHHQHGKGRLTRREHGSEIHAAVKRFDDELIAHYRKAANRTSPGGQTT